MKQPTCVSVSWYTEAVRVVIDESLSGTGECLRRKREVLTALGVKEVEGRGISPIACNKQMFDIVSTVLTHIS
jgi:hypothetical protein